MVELWCSFGEGMQLTPGLAAEVIGRQSNLVAAKAI